MSNADVFIVGVNVIIKHLHFALFAKTQIQIISNESMSVRNPRDSKLAAFDEVAWNQIWREQLRKEYEQESTLTPFQLNLKYRTSHVHYVDVSLLIQHSTFNPFEAYTSSSGSLCGTRAGASRWFRGNEIEASGIQQKTE